MGARAEIRTVEPIPGIQAMEPASMLVKHHRTARAEISTDQLGGGNLLHLSLAGCVFNNLLRIAADRGIRVTNASVVASGGFSADGDASTGIECRVAINGEATREDLVKVARDAFDDSSIAAILRRCTAVELVEVSRFEPAQGGSDSRPSR